MESDRWKLPRVLSPLLLMLSASTWAQSPVSLEQENQRLREQIQAMQKAGCNTSLPSEDTWRDAQLSARVASIRVGSLNSSNRKVGVTIAITLTNTGSTPLALNYVSDSFAITDSNGYRYTRRNATDYGNIKGMPIATSTRADTQQPLMPGQSSTVTILGERSMPQGQTPGQFFDISATFAAFVDEGQGRIRKTRAFPVSFTNVQAGSNGSISHQPGEPNGKDAGRVARRLLEGLIK